MCLIEPTVKFVDCMCTREYTYFLFLKNRADREIYSIDYVLSTISLCLSAHLDLAVAVVKVQVLRLFLFQLAICQLN